MNIIEKQVEKILDRVKREGDRALCYYSRKFDGVKLKPSQFRIPRSELRRAYNSLPRDLLKALQRARENIASFYQKEKRTVVKNWMSTSPGKTVGQRWIPLDAVGIYVPGGTFSYPSTVLMAAVPARIAGVKKVIVISPPGKITREVLASAWVAGIDQFYRIGGPAGIAALAYGTKSIPSVDKIIGPGNIYVTTAKKLLYGVVGIDMLAGPSEVAIVADNPEDWELIVQDMKAQQEHEVNARAFLISLNRPLTRKIRQADSRVRIKQVTTLREAADALNSIAPEHAQLMTRNNSTLLRYIRSAGTVCIGRRTPVAIGDYVAGPSHILPTGQTARFSSGLSITDFYKKINIIQYTKESSDFVHGIRIAQSEGMKEHRDSLQRRLR